MRKKIEVNAETLVCYVETIIDCPICGSTGDGAFDIPKTTFATESLYALLPVTGLGYYFGTMGHKCSKCLSTWKEVSKKKKGQDNWEIVGITDLEIEIENSVDYINS